MAFSPNLILQKHRAAVPAIMTALEEYFNTELTFRFNALDTRVEIQLPECIGQYRRSMFTHKIVNHVTDKFRDEGWRVETRGNAYVFSNKE